MYGAIYKRAIKNLNDAFLTKGLKRKYMPLHDTEMTMIRPTDKLEYGLT